MFVDLMWASIARCLTPTFLFLLLNLMIATIALISKLNQHQNKPNQPSIATSPSLHRQPTRDSETSTLPNPNTQSHDFFQQVSESFQVLQSQAAHLFDESSEPTETQFSTEPDEQLSMDEVYSKLTTSMPSDAEPASGDMPARMGKPVSLKHIEVEERGQAKVTEGDAEVDAKADDFINRFREQLKLQQRVESAIKYKNIMMSGEVDVI